MYLVKKNIATATSFLFFNAKRKALHVINILWVFSCFYMRQFLCTTTWPKTMVPQFSMNQ